jgi:hypothetical protein
MVGAAAGRRSGRQLAALLPLALALSPAGGCGGTAATADAGSGAAGGAGGHAAGGGGLATGSGGAAGATGATGGGAGGAASGGAGGHFASGAWVTLGPTNNAATLTGATLGNCSGSSSTVRRRQIPLLINGGSGDFQIGDAYLLEDQTAIDYAILVAPVKNVGTVYHCGIGPPTNGYDWLDAQGMSMNVTSGPAVIGSEGDVGMPPYYDESCLAPGDTGFIIDNQRFIGIVEPYNVVATVTLALVSQKTGVAPGAIVIPQSYTYKTIPVPEVDIVLGNVGTAAAVIAGLDYGTYILLDSGGLPTWIGSHLNDGPDSSPSPTNPGYFDVGTAGLGYDLPPAYACGTALRAIIKFEGPTAPWTQ